MKRLRILVLIIKKKINKMIIKYKKLSGKNKKIIGSLAICVVILFSGLIFYNIIKPKELTPAVFKTKDYTYLSPAALDYVKDYYEETGIILRTEKNKIENVPYLNPDYVMYLDNGRKASESGYIPDVTINDYDYSKLKLGSAALPSKYDSRDVDGKSYVTRVKDQSGYSICWAFSQTAVLESKILKEGLWKEDSELDLSERQIDYATATPTQAVDIGINPFYSYTSLSNLGDSGNEHRYFSATASGISPVKEEDWNIDYKTVDKFSPKEVWNLEKSNYDVDEYNNYSTRGSSKAEIESLVNILKQKIMENGSIEIGLPTAHGNPFVKYIPTDGEQLSSPNTTKYNVLYYRDSSYTFPNDHSVAIIGWDDNYTHNVCVKQNGELSDSTYSNGVYTCDSGTLKTIRGAWIMKNSYGERESDFYAFNPHAYIAFESTGVSYSSINKISEKNYDNVYLKSVSGNTTYHKEHIRTYEKPNKVEKISKIKIDTDYTNLNLDIFVDFNDDGNFTPVGSIKTTYSGIYSLDLSNITDKLTKQKFSVKISSPNIESQIINKIYIFTENADKNILIDMNDVKTENTIQNQVVKKKLSINEDNIIMLNGISRNLNNDKEIEFKITKNGVDFTNKFKFYRNYEVSNYINAIVSFNNDVSLGTYNVTANVDGKEYDNFSLIIDKYTENLEGTGTAKDPYIIKNAKQLNMMRYDAYAFYKLANDIDLTYDTQNENGAFYNDGKGWEPISYGSHMMGFSGGLDGNGYSIVGLYINRPNEDHIGLFSIVYNENYSNLYIKNITFKDSNVKGKKYVGALSGTIKPATYERMLTLKNIGIINGQINGVSYVGGISGHLNHAGDRDDFRKQYYENLYNSSTITATENFAGGLFGKIDFHPSKVYGLQITMKNMFNVGNVSSDELSGGLIGDLVFENSESVLIDNVYNTGSITGLKAGEIIGEASDTANGNVEFSNVYYYNSDKPYNRGNYSTNNVSKKTYEEISNNNIYSSWTNFDSNWNLLKQNNQNYFPTLKNVKFDHIKNMSTINDEILINLDNIDDIVQSIVVNMDRGISNKELYYYSENEKIATVTQKGKVTGVGAGTTNIVVISKYDGTSLSIPVTISGTVVNVESVSLNKDRLTLEDITPVALNATVSPSNATNKKVKWSSSNEEIATVDQNGNVTAKKNGNTTIIVTTVDGSKTAECLVTVDIPVINVESVSLDKTSLSLLSGKVYKLNATVSPNNATNKKVKWSSSNSSVATVDESGNVTAVSTGTTNITVTTEDGSKTATCIVTVSDSSDTNNKTCSIALSNRLPGDLDCNGKISYVDVVILLRHYGNVYKITNSDTLTIADVDNDGKVTMADLVKLNRYVGKVENRLCNKHTGKCISW